MAGISAQVSLYPLGQEDLSQAIEDALLIFQEHGLDVNPGSMSTLLTGEAETVFSALQDAFRRAVGQGRVVMVVTFSNACPLPAKDGNKIAFNGIGSVQNEFSEPAPLEEIRSAESRIILDPNLVEGLHGLEPGQQLMVIFHFHRSVGYDLLQHPRGDQSQPKRGVFALRSPRRPTPIGVTVVELVGIDANVLRVRGLDALDGTPVLDLKPA